MAARLHIDHQAGEFEPGTSVLEAAAKCGIQVPTSCARQGRCKECLIEVTGGEALLNARAAAEAHLHSPFRLACCARLDRTEGEVHCRTPRRGALVIERHASDLPGHRSLTAIAPAVIRQDNRVLLDGHEIDRRDGTLHGLAIDIGTTTVVLRIVNLETGATVVDAAFENPQRLGGSDVMARIRFDGEDPGHSLRKTLLAFINRTIREMAVDPRSIYEVAVAGNTTMRDLFFGLSVQSIGQSPFQSVTEAEVASGQRSTTALTEKAWRMRLLVHPEARVYGLPIISGHVGADAAACMLAIDLANERRVVALMDIGTNTELILGHRDRVYAASCPAGPAFEGGQITFGMPALTGAIDSAAIGDGGVVSTHVIGDTMGEGICGSGLVDLLSELRRTGRINELGRFRDGHSNLVLPTPADVPITLSEADINALVQAKAANAAGLTIVADDYGVRFEDIEVFYLAGGFGRHLNLAAARRIGLIPPIPDSRIRQVGNAAIEGATLALLSRPKRAELEQLVRRTVHRQLELHPRFFDRFVDGCLLNPLPTTVERPRGTGVAS